jgi:hypothetical protein
MNKRLILLLFFLTILTCSSKSEKPIPERQLEGWAGNPDNPNEKPFDYFYMKSAARASQRSIDRKSGKMMEATCIEYATYHSKENLIRKMVVESIYGGDPPSGQLYTPFFLNGLLTLNYSRETRFYSRTKEKFFNPFYLITVKESVDIRLELIEEYQKKIKGVEVKDCKPLAIPGQEVPLSEWKECEFTIYAHIPGGRDAIITRYREHDRE